jgi:hypothetical protein
MKGKRKNVGAANQVGCTDKALSIINNDGIIITEADLEITSDSIDILDCSHKLKKAQIKDLNELVNTVSKYEVLIGSLGKVTHALFKDFLESGQNTDTEQAKIYKNILDLYHALLPAGEDGWYNMVDHVLLGKWNKEKKAYERYR